MFGSRASFSVLFACLLIACGDDDAGSRGSAAEGGSGGTAQGGTGGTAQGGGAGAEQGGSGGTAQGGSGGTAQGGSGGTAQGGSGGTGGSTGCVPSLPTFADGKVPNATSYVNANAAPGGDGSQAQPFDTLIAALNAATPGTEVRVTGELAAPTYAANVKGTPDAPIWITGEPGAKLGALTLEGASSIILQDLELSNSPDGHVLHFFFADHLLFRRLKIHDAGLGCIKGSQTTNAYLEDSELSQAGKVNGHPTIDFVGVNGGHIVRSKFHDGPGVMIMLKGGTSDMLFAWNEVYAQTSVGNALSLGQSTGPQYFQPLDAQFEGLRIIAFANLLHDLVGPPVAFEGCKDCAALHNTIWNTTGGQLVRFLPGAAGQDSGATTSLPEGCRFAGNIVVGGQDSGASLNADASSIGPGNVVDYNVFLKPGGLNWWGDIPQDLVHSTYTEDPQLSSAGVPGNTALVDGKGPPDIDAIPFTQLLVHDFAGRCITSPTDIGAHVVP